MLQRVHSDRLRVTVAPQHGFTIAGIALAGSDHNVLWNPPTASFDPLPTDDLGPAGEPSIEYFDRRILAGGWFPMFPTAGLPGSAADRWMHGELPRVAWQVTDQSDAHVTAVVDTPGSGIRVHRTVRVVSDTVAVTIRAENRSGRTQRVTYGEHPCFARSLFASGAVLAHPARARVTSAADPPNAHLIADADFPWPTAPSAAGDTIDLSKIPATADGRHDHISLADISSVQLRGARHVVDLAWDPVQMPHALLWQHFRPAGSPWDGDVFAIEPMSAPGRTFDDAEHAGSVTDLLPGHILRTWMSMRVSSLTGKEPHNG